MASRQTALGHTSKRVAFCYNVIYFLLVFNLKIRLYHFSYRFYSCFCVFWCQLEGMVSCLCCGRGSQRGAFPLADSASRGRGLLRQNTQVAPVCEQTAAARTVVGPRCSLRSHQRSLEQYLQVVRAYLRRQEALYLINTN